MLFAHAIFPNFPTMHLKFQSQSEIPILSNSHYGRGFSSHALRGKQNEELMILKSKLLSDISALESGFVKRKIPCSEKERPESSGISDRFRGKCLPALFDLVQFLGGTADFRALYGIKALRH